MKKDYAINYVKYINNCSSLISTRIEDIFFLLFGHILSNLNATIRVLNINTIMRVNRGSFSLLQRKILI